jgi:hypothetical protein
MSDARLIVHWPSKEPEAAAGLLKHELKAAAPDFRDVRTDRHVPELRRGESRDGAMVSRWLGEQDPTWRIGWTEREVILMVDFPALTAIRQRRLSLLRWDTYEVNDRDREERWHRRVLEATHRSGLNPDEARVEWTLAPPLHRDG